MTNPFYVATGTPGTLAFGASQPMRSEFAMIQGGFDKFPDFTASAPGTFLINNFTGTGITTAPGMTVDSNGNVGIGVPYPPGSVLDINRSFDGSVGIRMTNPNTGSNAAAVVRVDNAAGYYTGLYQFSPNLTPNGMQQPNYGMIYTYGNGLSFSSGYGPMLFGTGNSTEKMRLDVDGNLFCYQTIKSGMTGRSGDFHVARQTDGVSVARMYALDSPADGLGFEVGGSAPMTWATGTGQIGSGNTHGGSMIERMRLIPGGWLGIGTPTPNYILDILENKNAGAGIHIANNDPGASAYAQVRLTNNSPSTAVIYLTSSNYTPAGADDVSQLTFYTNGQGIAFWNATASPIKFWTGGSECMRITAQGYVGIGTTNPIYLLDISRNQDAATVLRLSNFSNGVDAASRIFLSNGPYTSALSLFGINAPVSGMVAPNMTFLQGSNGLTVATVNGDSPVYFGTNNTERMRLVSHGTTGGELRMSGTSGANAPKLSLVASGFWTWGLLGDGDTLKVVADSTALMNFVGSTGNVGVGASPAGFARLDVRHDNAGFGGVQAGNYNTGGYAGFRIDTGSYQSLIYLVGTTYTPGGVDQPGRTVLYTNGPGISFYAPDIRFFAGNVEMMRCNSYGLSFPRSDGIQASRIFGKQDVETGLGLEAGGASPIVFYIASGSIGGVSPECGRFTGQRYFRATDSGGYQYAVQPTHEIDNSTTTNYDIINMFHRGPDPYGLMLRFAGADPNNGTNYFLRCYNDYTGRDLCRIMSNGGIGNFQANNVAYSDASIKTPLALYTPAELDALETAFKAVDWGKFKFLDQTHDDWNYGYTAQGVEAAFGPAFVDEIDMSVRDEIPGPKVKVVFYTDLTNIAHALLARALQRIAVLEQQRV